MEAKHDGEGGGRQQDVIAIVIEAVGCCHRKSISNLATMMCNLLSDCVVNFFTFTGGAIGCKIYNSSNDQHNVLQTK